MGQWQRLQVTLAQRPEQVLALLQESVPQLRALALGWVLLEALQHQPAFFLRKLLAVR